MQLLHELTVPSPAPSQRIDVFLSTKLRKFSRNKIQNLIEKQAVLVNGKSTKADYKINALDHIEVFAAYQQFNEKVTPEDIPLDIVFEDDAIIVINKAPGMPVHKGLGNYRGTLINALAFHFLNSGLNITIEEGSVHRLDSGTSGLIVYAKTRIAKQRLEQQMKNQQVHRVYQALVYGNIASESGVIDVPIGRNPENPMIIQAFPLRDEGKVAVTHYRVVERYSLATLVECKLETGRTHQIRIHQQYIGHALLGDPRYPGAFGFKEIKTLLEELNVSYQLLHAKELRFVHPTTQEECVFEAPLPAAFQDVINNLVKV